ncbi:MAG: PAS domain-containing sensor histidine kinase, partial [Candidatus Eisenbacteria bacterium]|nr:PAS domain-containing sensor histidine kinase [Candidatus Eisenbacteria bacterium]
MTDRETSREATDAPEIAPGLFHRFFEDSTDAIVVTDREGKILTANPAWLSLYGYRLEEVAGRSTSIVKSPHTTPEMYRYMWSKIGDPSQGFWKGEIVNRKRDGTEVPVLLTITPIRDRDGGIAGYTGIGIDMTERRRAEEMRELYEMVVRHDLKTPLGSILALAETLREGYAGPLDERQRDLVSRIVGSALRMREMIETGLDLKRFERGVLRLDPADIDLLDMVRRSADGLAPLAREREVVVAVMAGGGRAARPEDRLPLRADPVHLQRAIDSLVKNAIEASPRGGDVVVTAAEVK